MNNHARHLVAFSVAAAGMLPSAAAQAQYYGASYAQPAPLYPYAAQGDQPYAVEVAPNTYMIQRAAPARAHPHAGGRRARTPTSSPGASANERPRKTADRGLIEELRKRGNAKGAVINTTRIVRDPPVVVETTRVVDDPPRVIERRRIVEDAPTRPRRAQPVAADNDIKKRVIQADAEVTILGPDRMSIRLFRKGHNAKASAHDE